MLFYVAKTPDIASRLFWSPEKALSFRFGKSPFVLKNNYFPNSKNLFFSSPRRSKLREGCSGALKRRPLSDSKNRLFS